MMGLDGEHGFWDGGEKIHNNTCMKKLILLISAAVLLLILLSLASVFLGKSRSIINIVSFPTPPPVGLAFTQPTATPLKLISLSPTDGTTGVNESQEIIATFNQPITTESARFSLFPDVAFTTSSRLDSLILQPTTPYEDGIVYKYSVFQADGTLLASATFSAGLVENPVVPLTGRYPNLDTVADTSQRDNFPDVFLAGYVPYQNSAFSVTSDFSSSPSGHYEFFVSPNTQNAKNSFVEWLKTLGLTSEQIGRISITYQ